MSARRGPRPVIVEVKPDNASTIAPSSPSTSPKVRFATTSTGPVAGVSRPLTSVEAWSLFHFEKHARECETCFEPEKVLRRGGRLCHTGRGLAQDVSYHVQYRNGEIYSREIEDSDYARVEVPHGYSMLRSLLKGLKHPSSSSHRSSARAPAPPVVSYDPQPSSRRRSSYIAPESVIIEPGFSTSSSQQRSKNRRRYSTIAVAEDDYAVRIDKPSKERRGTLYEKDQQRKKEQYRVEIRRPQSVIY